MVWALSVPLLFAEIGETLIYATDTAFLGRVGTTELGAIALADTAIEIWVVPALGLVEAMQITIARRAGEGRRSGVGATFTRGFALALAVSILLAAAVKLGSPDISRALISSDAVATAVDDFLQAAAYGLVLMSVNLAYSALYVGLGKARVLIWATVVLVLSNLALSYLLVLGNLGAPRLGIEGAGYAFTGAEAATFVYLALHTVRRRDLAHYGIFQLRAWGEPLLRPLLRLSSPVALQALVESARWLGFFLLLEQVSDDALAVSSVVYACFAVLLIPAQAFGETTYSLVSRLIGRGHGDQIGRAMRRIVVSAYLVTGPLLLLVLLEPELPLAVFTSNPETSEAASRAVQVAALAMVLVIPAELWLGALLGTGDADAGLAVELLLSVVLIGGAAASGLLLDLRVEYIWLSVPAAAAVAFALAHARVRSGRWRQKPV